MCVCVFAAYVCVCVRCVHKCVCACMCLCEHACMWVWLYVWSAEVNYDVCTQSTRKLCFLLGIEPFISLQHARCDHFQRLPPQYSHAFFSQPFLVSRRTDCRVLTEATEIESIALCQPGNAGHCTKHNSSAKSLTLGELLSESGERRTVSTGKWWGCVKRKLRNLLLLECILLYTERKT